MKRMQGIASKVIDFVGTLTAQRIVLGLFVLQALVLAAVMHIGVPPDESNHIEFIDYYESHSISPVLESQTPTWSLGDKTREVDYLYHYGASLISRILPGETIEVYALRIISVAVALLTMILLVRLLRRLNVPAGAITVALLVITNLPMVLMVSAAVNNDVFVWFGYVASLLLIMRLWQRANLLELLLLLNIIVAGGLIKRTFLPLSLIFGLAAVVIILKKWNTLKMSFKKPDWKIILAAVGLIVSVGLFAERIGGNILSYRTISPSCEQVQGEEACSIFWVNSRERWIESGAPASGNIWLHGDVAIDEQLMSLPTFGVKWLDESTANIVDVQTQGWGHVVAPPLWLSPILLVILIGFIGYGIVYDFRRWKEKNHVARWRLFAIATALFIVMVQLQVNYGSYAKNHIYGLALNGRYIIPALLVLIGLACFYAGRLLPRWAQAILAFAVVGCILLFSGLFMMVRNPQLFTG